jgi:hypothetical protein
VSASLATRRGVKTHVEDDLDLLQKDITALNVALAEFNQSFRLALDAARSKIEVALNSANFNLDAALNAHKGKNFGEVHGVFLVNQPYYDDGGGGGRDLVAYQTLAIPTSSGYSYMPVSRTQGHA